MAPTIKIQTILTMTAGSLLLSTVRFICYLDIYSLSLLYNIYIMYLTYTYLYHCINKYRIPSILGPRSNNSSTIFSNDVDDTNILISHIPSHDNYITSRRFIYITISIYNIHCNNKFNKQYRRRIIVSPDFKHYR